MKQCNQQRKRTISKRVNDAKTQDTIQRGQIKLSLKNEKIEKLMAQNVKDQRKGRKPESIGLSSISEDQNEDDSSIDDPKDSTFDAKEVHEEGTVDKRRLKINEEDKRILMGLSPDFSLTFKGLNLRKINYFQSKSKEEMKTIKSWYKYRHRIKAKKIPTQKEIQLPKINAPNEIMLKLTHPALDLNERNYIASVLEESLSSSMHRYFSNKFVDELLRDLQNTVCFEDIRKIIQSAPLSLRLKSTAKAIAISKEKNNDEFNENLKVSWFNLCIKPALNASTKISFKDFDDQEVDEIKSICVFNGPANLNDDEAINLIRLLKHGQQLDLDQMFQYFCQRKDDFWMRVLTDICGVGYEVAQTWVQHKFHMITKALYSFYSIYSIDHTFNNQLSLFQRLTQENLKDLGLLRQSPNFSAVIGLLDKKKVYDFNLFKRQAETYLRMESFDQLKVLKSTLQDKPLEKWIEYKNAIMASDSFKEEEQATLVLREVIERAMKFENMKEPNDEIQKKLEDLYTSAFQTLTRKTILVQFQWQKELVIFLAYLILYRSKRNIVVSLGTGHGKSVVIQLLADVLHQASGSVNIVTLNRFLAYWGKKNFSSGSGKISYLDIDHLIRKIPANTTHVIYDEIDQMIGANSFNLNVEEGKARASYFPSLMKKWKTVIGFSGTISSATLDQIREELKDPFCIEIPSLRKSGMVNTLSAVLRVPQEQKRAEIIKTIQKQSPRYKNFIVIVENPQEAEALIQNEEFKASVANKMLVDFVQFKMNFAETEQKLRALTKDNFAVITTPEGGRGIDYKGLTVGHVIIAFDPASLSQTQQCIGRGVRDINDFTEATIISSNPPTLDPSEYLSMLEALDAEKAQAMHLNCKVARMLHGQSHKQWAGAKVVQHLESENPDAHLTMIYFKGFMERGENFITSQAGMTLWTYLRKIDSSGSMPVDPYQDWNY